jgi:hypothetical protein
MSNLVTTNRYSYHGPLEGVSYSSRYFFAWKGAFIIGTYNTFDEAVDSLVWRESLKQRCEMIGPSQSFDIGYA